MASETLEDKKQEEEAPLKSKDETTKEDEAQLKDEKEQKDEDEQSRQLAGSNDVSDEPEQKNKESNAQEEGKKKAKRSRKASVKKSNDESAESKKLSEESSELKTEPVTPSSERPTSWERKVVERYSVPSSGRSATKPVSIEKGRGKSFSVDEDELLCHVYLEITQDLVMGMNQKKDSLWERINIMFHSRRPSFCTVDRSPKSLACRMSIITKAISKFRGCVRRIEHLYPSGASEMDIINRAKVLFSEEKEYKLKRFQFDHVWPILKDIEKWMDNGSIQMSKQGRKSNGFEGSQLEESPIWKTSRASSSFIDLNAKEDEEVFEFENVTPTSMGRSKGKMKRKQNDDKKNIMEMIQKNTELLESFQKNDFGEKEKLISPHLQGSSAAHDELAKQKLRFRQEREETRIMEKDLDSIRDPNEREYWRSRKIEIMENRARNFQIERSFSNNIYGNFNSSKQFQGGSSGIGQGFSSFSPFLHGYGGNTDDLS